MKTLAPSILASDMLYLGAEIKKIEKSGSKYVHVDVMDGCFVPNISFGMPIISAVRSCTDLVVDVHAMIVNPDKYIKDFAKAGADIITFHLEALEPKRVMETIDAIHKEGLKAGISIKPGTDVKELIPYIKCVEMVLIMTVEPGFGGQKFMQDMMDKVRFVREVAEKENKELDIQVDGGINNETLKVAMEAGANIFVLGTAFFKSETLIDAEKLLGE
ncbi:MAG: ribulose-phosphate 3-epimerase [Clostridia bacterium]|nr:ribulose-phosphate 3-epimerase [Clostridia bacterium]